MLRRNIGTILENVLDICLNCLKLSMLCSGKGIRFILLIFPCCQLLLFLSETGHRGNRFSIGELVQGLPCSFIEKNFRFMRLSKIPLVFCFHIRSKHFLVGKEDLQDVETFFKNQVQIFDAAAQMEEDLRNELDYLSHEPEANAALNKIRLVVAVQGGFSYKKIPELNGLMATVREGHDRLLEFKREELNDKGRN